MSSLAIRADAVSQSYRHYQVLRDVSFELAAGSCYALFGPNGAGKTTLLKILATVQRPSAGRFELLGRDGIADRATVRGQLFFLAHGSHLYDDLNAIENLRFALGLRGLAPADRDMKLALDRVGIGAFADLRTRYFSAGMKKRLAIAKALLAQPRLLLMDEAYASLDEKGMALVNLLIRESRQRGAAVFLSSHDRAKAAEVADRAGVLRQGRLHEVPIAELLTSRDLF
ncbi:MAG: heme ABC exporter ATP-binding protein CcmA [Nitrospirota bacterium]